jgi:hypothetical protein
MDLVSIILICIPVFAAGVVVMDDNITQQHLKR